jgi:hypothetical protein
MLDPREGATLASLALAPDARLVLVIGPEGGFSERDVAALRAGVFSSGGRGGVLGALRAVYLCLGAPSRRATRCRGVPRLCGRTARATRVARSATPSYATAAPLRQRAPP